MPDSHDPAPNLRLVVDNSAEHNAASARLLDIFLHTKAVAADPEGDGVWVLLDRNTEPGTAA